MNDEWLIILAIPFGAIIGWALANIFEKPIQEFLRRWF